MAAVTNALESHLAAVAAPAAAGALHRDPGDAVPVETLVHQLSREPPLTVSLLQGARQMVASALRLL